MSEQDSDAAGWDSELDDVDLCCTSPSSSASTSSETGTKQAGVSRAGLIPSDFVDGASTSAAQTAASRTSPDSSSAAANAAASRSSSLSSMHFAASRVASNPGGPLFSLAVADLSSGNAGSSGGAGRTPSFKQLAKPDSQAAAAAASAAHHSAGKPCQQQQQESGDSVLPALQQSAQPQIRSITTKIPSLPMRMSADNLGTVSSSGPFNSALASSDIAAIAAATAAAGLKPPSPTSLARSSLNDNQQYSSRRPGVRRASPSSHHAHRQAFGGVAQQGPGVRGNKPPPLSLFSTSTSSPGHSPHACAHAGTGANGGAAASSAGWAGVSATEPNRRPSQAEPQQLVKVQLLLPALDVYLPLQAAEAAPGAPISSSSIRNPGSIQQKATSCVSWSNNDGGLLKCSTSGDSSSAATVGSRSISNSRGRSSFGGSLVAAGAYPAGEAEGQGGAARLIQDQHAGDSTTAAADMLQNAISRALGVEASQLIYYATQHEQLSEVLQRQQQQQPQQPQPARQHSQAHESISSAGAAAGGGSRLPSRGPSPSRGSNASSSKMEQAPSLPLPGQPQQPWSVVVGFPEGSCEFSLSRLEEILRCTSAMGGDARLQETTKQLQEDLVRAKTRSMELTGDLARLQRAYNQVSQELNSHKLALLEARSELAVAGDSFVKLEALHRPAGTTKGRRSQSNSPRKGQQHRSSSRGPPSARSHQHQEQQQSPLTKFAAAAATAAADAAEQPTHPLHPQPAATAALAALASAGRAAGSSSLDYNDLVALMSRVASPGFLNFMQQFLLIYEQQSCCSAADLAAAAAAMAGNAAAGASSFHTGAVATPRASRSSSTGRSRTPRQHLSRGTAGGGGAASAINGKANTPTGPGMLAHLAKQLQQQQQQHCSPSSAHGAAAVTAATAELNGGSSSGRRTGRRKGATGRPVASPL